MDGYHFPKTLVNSLIVAIFLSLISIAGYMVAWNSSYHVNEQHYRSTLKHQAERMAVLEERLSNHPHGSQILPEAAIRLKILENWQSQHMRDHRDNP